MKLKEGQTYDLKEVTANYLLKAINQKNYSPEMVVAIAELYKALVD